MLGNTLDCFPLSNTECYDLIKNKGNEIFEYDFIKSLAPMWYMLLTDEMCNDYQLGYYVVTILGVEV